MPRIVGIEPVVPEYCYGQEEAREFTKNLFGALAAGFERLLPVFDNSAIRTRHFCMPAEWYYADHSFSEKNLAYIRNATKLSGQAVLRLCERHRITPQDLDHIFFVSTTGISTPSIDAHLFNTLGLKSSVRRTPIWGLGCAGGIAGLARANDWLKAYPSSLALMVAIELCSLTWIQNDVSASNFVAMSLFGDGGAAVLLAGDESRLAAGRMLHIEGTEAVTWPDSLEVMGWDLKDEGLKVIFSKDIPTIVRDSAKPVILQFLSAHGINLADLAAFLSHPGGVKVINAYAEALGLPDAKTKFMWNVLSKYGNMSSATVLFVLDEFLRSDEFVPGGWVLSTSLGPGFSSEMVLSRCQ